jgi:hypothetical protein
MGYKRIFSKTDYFTGINLTRKLKGIGFRFSGEMDTNENIEDCLISACIEGMNGDFRVLSLLTDWIFIHFKIINADRLFRALLELNNKNVKCYFVAILKNFKKEFAEKKFSVLYKGSKITLGDEFLLIRNGEDARFKNTKLSVPNKLLRSRPDDILEIKELAKLHNDYFYRALIGPSYRADMISKLISNPKITAAELARSTYGSFATAWEIINEIEPMREVFTINKSA